MIEPAGDQTCGGTPASAESERCLRRIEEACLAAGSREANNSDVTLLEERDTGMGIIVTIGVGPQVAPWSCAANASRNANVMSLTDEAAL